MTLLEEIRVLQRVGSGINHLQPRIIKALEALDQLIIVADALKGNSTVAAEKVEEARKALNL